jgi:hypothetical protein
MAKSSNNIVYDGYVKTTFKNEKFKRKSRSILSENQYLTLKVKALEKEKGISEENIVSLRKDPQTTIEVVGILNKKREKIKALEVTRSVATLIVL